MKTKREVVTFPHSFSLEGVDGVVPAGTYAIDVDEDLIEGLSFLAYQRVSTTIYLPLASGSTSLQAIKVDPREIDAAQKAQTGTLGSNHATDGL